MNETTSGGTLGVQGGGAALARRKGTLVAFVAGFAALGLVINNVTPAVYRATVRIELRAPLDRSPLTGEAVGISRNDVESMRQSLVPDSSALVVVLEDRWVKDVQRDMNQVNARQVIANQIASK